MDTWADSLPEGQTVALTAGSNTAADQPAIGLGSAHQAGRLGHGTGYPNRCVRLAKEFRAAQVLAPLTPGGHFLRTRNRPPHEGGSSKEFTAFRAQLLKDAKAIIAATREAAEALRNAAPVALLIIDEAGQAH
eukprot:9235284-Pyramimonas_sp.AAC.1